jgi:hypothetical protein
MFLLHALPDHATEPSVQAVVKRYLTHVVAAIERLKQLEGSSSPWDNGLAGSARDVEAQT